MATDALNWVTLKLDAETMKSILDGVTMETTERADAQDVGLAEADEEIHKQVQETVILAQTAYVNLHMTDWVYAQQEDPILKTMIEWISGQKVQDLKHLLGDDPNTEEGKEQKKLMIYQGALYHLHTPTGKLEEVFQFVVPMAHWVAAMNGCHQDAWHQGQQGTLYLLHDWFWWPGMATQMQKAISNHEQCIQHEGTHAKGPVWCIIVTGPFEFLHIDNNGAGSIPKCGEHFGLLWTLYKTCYGICDKGANFESSIIRVLGELMGIWKVRTSPYHAQTNEQVEWAHQTQMHMIGKLSKDWKAD